MPSTFAGLHPNKCKGNSTRLSVPMSGEREKLSSTVSWRIENIGSPDYDIHQWEVCSPTFPLNNLGENEWQLCFLPSNKTQFDICLRAVRYVESISLICEWSILDDKGSPLLTRVMQYKTIGSQYDHFMFKSLETEDIVLDRNSIFLSNDTLTVRLRVWKTDEDFVLVEYVSVVTRLLEKPPVDIFFWNIVNFGSLRLDQEATTIICLRGLPLKFNFFLTGESLDDASINFGIEIENTNLESLRMKISFMDKDGSVKKCVEAKHKFNSTKGKQTWVVPKVATRREILETPSDWLNGEDLNFHFELECGLRSHTSSYIDSSYCGPENLRKNFGTTSNVERNVVEAAKFSPSFVTSIVTKDGVETSLEFDPTYGSNEERRPTSNLGADLLSFYKERVLSDFELLVGDVSFPVHKTILSARSPVFRAMFCDDAKTESRSADVPDLDADTLRLFLAYLYGEALDPLRWESARKLYNAAVKYQVPYLKMECSRILRSSLTVSNVCDILELADIHQDEGLTSDIHDFIDNHFDEVVLSNQWDKFLKRSNLAGKTMKEIHRRKNATLQSVCKTLETRENE